MLTTIKILPYQRQPSLLTQENADYHSSDRGLPLEASTENGTERTRSITITMEEPPRFPKEERKTVIALVIFIVSFVLAIVSSKLAHQKLPLPDIIPDKADSQDWKYISEIIIVVSIAVTVTFLGFNKHRWIVFRRVFLILAALCLVRSVIMFATAIPILIGEKQTFCGNYIFSSHTIILVTSYLFFKEYSSPKLILLHWASFLASLTGIIMLVISNSYYTLDVLVAYYVTTRIFCMYHTLANYANLKKTQPQGRNHLSRIWWYSVFIYMEGNVEGPLPKKYSFPWFLRRRSRTGAASIRTTTSTGSVSMEAESERRQDQVQGGL